MVLNVIFKGKFIVKDKTKELCFFDNFYRRFFILFLFYRRMLGSGGKKRTADGNEYRPSWG